MALLKRLLLASVLLVGCKQVIKQEVVKVSPPYETTVSCNYSGFCFSCISFNGSGCGFKFSAFCSGSQKVRAHDELTEYTYDDGSKSTYDRRIIEERIGMCG